MGHDRSEPHQRNQNPAECRIQDIKRHCNVLLDRTGSPPQAWLLCMLYVIDLHNHMACPKLQNHITPIQKAFGYVPDISKFLQFYWWERVLYKNDTALHSFPSGTYEGVGRFVGITNNIGDALTYQILDEHTEQIVYRSCVRSMDPENPNIRVLQPPIEGEEFVEPAIPIVKTMQESIDKFSATTDRRGGIRGTCNPNC